MKKENYQLAEALRHELHQHPELSYHETWTKQHLMDFLKEHTSLVLHDGGKYFYAVYRAPSDCAAAGDKKAIAFRADFDALPIEDEIDKPWKSCVPGVGHKCGHDGHAAALCGLGLELMDMKPDRDVYMVFQHAEETGQGAVEAQQFIKDNPDIGEIYAFHNRPGEELGQIRISNTVANCASKGMSVYMKGTPTHASIPENGINPVFALTEIVRAIPEFTDPDAYEGLVLCTIVQLDVGDYAFGIAASEGVLRMTIRAEIEAEMDLLQKKIEDLAKAEAEKYGLQLKFEFEDVFPETRNDPHCVEKVHKAAEKLGYSVVESIASRGSEDFGYYTKLIPGAIYYIGGGVDKPSFHTSGFDFTDSIIENAVEMFKALIEE